MISGAQEAAVWKALDSFHVETPSWGFANTGTRFGKFIQAAAAGLAYMVDQSHNLKGKIEEMIQTAAMAQAMYAKAVLLDHAALQRFQQSCDLIDAEECLKSAFAEDVRPVLAAWRRSKGLAEDPLAAFRASGYLEKAGRERGARNKLAGGSYA